LAAVSEALVALLEEVPVTTPPLQAHTLAGALRLHDLECCSPRSIYEFVFVALPLVRLLNESADPFAKLDRIYPRP
jgi:hypothetical protein